MTKNINEHIISLQQNINKEMEEIKDLSDKLENKEEFVFQLKKNVANLKLKRDLDLNIGDFFIDKDGNYGIYLGYENSKNPPMGKLLNKKHNGYVYPFKKISFEEFKELKEK